MKKYVLFFLIVLGVLLVIPGIVGFKVQEQYQEMLERTAQSGFEILEQEYHRGWFASEARAELRIAIQASVDATEPLGMILTLENRIDHGLLTSRGLALAEIETDLLLDGESLFPEDYPGVIATQILLGGSGTTVIELPAIDLAESEERPAVRFGGLSGVVDFDSAMENVSVRMGMPGLEVIEDDMQLVKVGEASIESRSWLGESGLTLGSGDLKLNDLSIYDAASGEQVSLQGLGLVVDSSEQDGQVAGFATYSLNRLEIGDKEYGPGTLKVELVRWSAPVLLELQQSVEDMQGQQMTEAQRSMAIMGVLMGSASEFLGNDPGMSIDPLRFSTPDGELNARFSLNADGLRWEHVGNPRIWMTKLDASLSLRIPEKLLRSLLENQARTRLVKEIEALTAELGEQPLVEQEQLDSMVDAEVQGQMEQWLGQGLLKYDQEYVITEAQLAEGQLTINGQQIPLPGLQQ